MTTNSFRKNLEKFHCWYHYRRREFTTRCILPFPNHKHPPMTRDVVTMSQLGRLGRFGNWIFQYMFLKCYCWQFDLEAQTPHWPGHDLFSCDDPLISQKYPAFQDPTQSAEGNPPLPYLTRPVKNVDLQGFFQYHTRFHAPDRERLQTLLTPNPKHQTRLNHGLSRIRTAGRTLVALHIRRGDYGEDKFYITPTSWYLALLDKIWPSLDRPVLYIATDEPSQIVQEFKRYPTLTSRDLCVQVHQAPYFVDFHILTQADILVIPNSTFSFAASMLNKNLVKSYRSHLSDPLLDPPFREFNPWNSVVLDVNAHVEKYPNIRGIRRAS